MPNMNGTGPRGMGPLTGRGLGVCGTGYGRGVGVTRGFGAGRGFGRGFGGGFGFRAAIAPAYPVQQPAYPAQQYPVYEPANLTKAEEKKILEAELKQLEAEKKEIEKRLKEIK